MKARRIICLLLSCLLVAGCLAMPAGAVATSAPEMGAVVTRATGRFEITIPANSCMTMEDSFILDSGDIVSFDCSYTPRDASVKFGYIGPDGLFYGISGYKGSIDKGIRVNQRGSYTLAIWNESDSAVTVWGTVNY